MKKAHKLPWTNEDLAVALDFSPRTIAAYRTHKGFPQRGRDGYDLAAVSEFIVNEKKKQIQGQGTGPLGDSKVRKLNLECELLEMKRDEGLKKLMPVADYLQALNRYASIVRNALESLPRDLAELCQNPSVKKIVTDKTDSVLAQIDEACSKDEPA